jgi:hypothetical protein
MRLRLIAFALLSTSMLAACGEKAAPADAKGANQDDAALDHEIQKDLTEIASDSIRLYGGRDQIRASIAQNGDFKVGGKTVAVDDAQRARLLAYRKELVALAQAGAELSARSADVATDKIGSAIENVFDGEKPGEAPEESKPGVEKMNASAQRVCDTLPALVREQQALAASLPEFAPYANFSPSDVDACNGASIANDAVSQKIGKTIGAALGNPFKGGMVAGYMTVKTEKTAATSTTPPATPAGK